MGLFTLAPKSSSHVSGSGSLSHRGGAANDGHIDQHGSMHGEINWHEYRDGVHGEIDRAFHGHERDSINALLREQFDSSSSNRRHVLDRHEVKAIVDDVHQIYSYEHAKKLQAILDKRLQ